LRQLALFQERFPEARVVVDGAPWSYRSTGGPGPAVIMLPGAHGTADLFYKLCLQLGHRLNLLTVTYPAWADCDRLASGLVGFMDALGLLRASICGAFLGGYVAQKFAHKNPTRIETLFLANSFYDAAAMQARMPEPERFAALPAAQVMEHHLQWMLAGSGTDAAHADLKRALQESLGGRQSAGMLKSRLLAILLCKPVGRVPLHGGRIVLMDSDGDALIPNETRAAMRMRYADAEHHRFDDAGHHLAMLRPEEFSKVIEKRLIP
jgi:pimeloyl-ACP methyl ester carboxylesterase